MADTDKSQPQEQVKQGGKIKGHVRHKQVRKMKCQAYLSRSTCTTCKMVFRSPKKRLAHVQSGHKSDIGWNKNRAAKQSVFA